MTHQQEHDEAFMAEALAEARKGLGRTHPNPAVGAIIVKQGRIIARGFHAKAGTAHAEIVALKSAGSRAKGATLYSTLEPCNHQGRTPPCCGAIIAAGIQRVVFASPDPNPLVDGKGARALRVAGLDVTARVLRDEADVLNRPFIKAMRTGLPWVTLKAAVTLDGKVATETGSSRWISSPESRAVVHRLRNVVDAVLVGAGTVVHDDPRLTTRLPGDVRDPIRVVMDPTLRTAPASAVYRPGARRVVIASARASAQLEARLTAKGVEVWRFPSRDGVVALPPVLKRLAREGALHVLVEGGPRLTAHFVKARCIDELALFVSPKLFGHSGLTWTGPLGVLSASKAVALENLQTQQVGPDVLITARLAR